MAQTFKLGSPTARKFEQLVREKAKNQIIMAALLELTEPMTQDSKRRYFKDAVIYALLEGNQSAALAIFSTDDVFNSYLKSQTIIDAAKHGTSPDDVDALLVDFDNSFVTVTDSGNYGAIFLKSFASATLDYPNTVDFAEKLLNHEKYFNGWKDNIVKNNFNTNVPFRNVEFMKYCAERIPLLKEHILKTFENDKEMLIKYFPHLDIFIF